MVEYPFGEYNVVGPITFSKTIPREQLQSEGEVVTFRASDRTTGQTWWRKTRNGKKAGNCTVECIGECNPRNEDELAEHRPRSGFDTVADWQAAIKDLHGSGLPESGYLYRVTARDD